MDNIPWDKGLAVALAFGFLALAAAVVRAVPAIFTGIKQSDERMLTWCLAAQKEQQAAAIVSQKEDKALSAAAAEKSQNTFTATIEKIQMSANATIERLGITFEKSEELDRQGFERRQAETMGGIMELKDLHKTNAYKADVDQRALRHAMSNLAQALQLRQAVKDIDDDNGNVIEVTQTKNSTPAR